MGLLEMLVSVAVPGKDMARDATVQLTTARLITALVLFCTSISCILFAGFVMFAMIGRINERVLGEEKISYLGGSPLKHLKIHREYRRLYPGGRLSLYYQFLVYCGMTLLLGFAWLIGFFH